MKATFNTLNLHNLRAVTLAALLTVGVGGLLTGCDDGPAEEAGESIDETTDEAGDAVEDTFD